MIRTYKSETQRDEDKSDGVGRFSHREQGSQAAWNLAATSTVCPRSLFTIHKSMTSA